MEEEKRFYNCSDGTLLDDAETKLGFYIIDKPSFTGYNQIIFTANYEVDVEAMINAARATTNDNLIVNQQAGETEDVDRTVTIGKGILKDLLFHVEQAFPNDENMLNQFGAKDFSKIGKNAKKMITQLEIAYKLADAKKAELIAVGFAQPKITAIKTVKDQLVTERQEQQKAIGIRPNTTQDRIKKHNLVFLEIKKIHKAAPNIFANDYAKLHQYDMPYAVNGSGDEEPPVPPAPAP